MLLDGSERFIGRGRLFFGGALDLFGAALRFHRSAFSLHRCGERLLGALDHDDEVLAKALKAIGDRAPRFRFARGGVGAFLHGAGNGAHLGFDIACQTLNVARALL